jgi:hypothetical protein
MSFDALTITGILAGILSGGFLIGLVYGNPPTRRCCEQRDEPEASAPDR